LDEGAPVKFNLFFLIHQPPNKSEAQSIGETLEQAEYAEELGYDAIWLAEHHFTVHGICGSPLQFLANLAARTRRIRLGQGVILLPFSHPIQIAEQSAMLDLLSNGRLDLGIGRGYLEPEFRGFGLSMADSTTMFRESYEVISGAWQNERFSFNGKHYQFDNLRIAPKPIQKPHPPIYVASVSPSSMAWATERGLRTMANAFTPFAELKELRTKYREELDRRGVDPTVFSDSAMQRQVFVAETTEEARALAGPALAWSAVESNKGGTSAEKGQYAKDYQYYERIDQMRKTRAETPFDDSVWFGEVGMAPLVGDPDEVIRRLTFIQKELDLGSFLVWMQLGGIEHKKVMRSMELFARHVMPKFRGTPSTVTGTRAAP
jgi:luciferase family oxidoreductase group 1